ncbi:lytic transglycosylase domain-containing protein [Methylobacterium sp. WL7]|uniref:lytic transglycosylase domain-containing protein n=1 Tax=Methylobacterium sp. WL7 TaxID=2603900 RepID=UPI0011CAA021|nr:lytic transglycosylase domain-containing protein [Methylobacterium sp. WL7]TXN39682.1 lytic transglycosylase domain-containing protein [Methylobacterium sp. WL7]
MAGLVRTPKAGMQELSTISEHSFRARVRRRAFCRNARSFGRSSAKFAIWTIALLLGATLTFFPCQPEPEVASPRRANTNLASRAPNIVAIMSVDGAIANFVQANLKAMTGLEALPQFIGALQDTWLNAFYGDKQHLTKFIEHTADASGLPVDFFLKLLQQESGLDHRAVSRAGAQGVAQFMPATATERGLIDPFDPFEAIPKAAEFLREQRAAFGSLGLAAAAYNAGPQRVRNWLAGRSALPQETKAYVAKITGRSADEWRQGGDMFATAEPVARTSW